MAPIRTARSKQSSDKTPKGGRKKSLQSKNQTGSNNTRSTTRVSKQVKGPPPKQQKTKSAPGPVKKKRKIYTEKELGIPKLNMITPAGVQLPKGKKKGKVFVDDQVWSRLRERTCLPFHTQRLTLNIQESMMTILAIVNASKEGQIESKMMKSRQMEEVREARRKEAEARQERKNLQLV